MKKINIKTLIFVFLITLGTVVAGLTISYAASTLASSSVYYDNSKSGGSSTNVSGAIDELYNLSDIRNRPNIIVGYTYNQTSGASNYCVTGDEETCQETKCYKTTTAGSCPAGTIIVYKVNETKIVRFHVMYDTGKALTMQSQKNTIYNTEWIDAEDYATKNTDSTNCTSTSCNDEGPMTILEALENATAGWTNVNTLAYTMGTTSLGGQGAYTGCSSYNTCTTNTYSLSVRSAKARMITTQEAKYFGCSDKDQSCPIFMYNYLATSTSYGGTINDINTGPNGTANSSYWTINASSTSAYEAWYINFGGVVTSIYNNIYNTSTGARAIVEINK